MRFSQITLTFVRIPSTREKSTLSIYPVTYQHQIIGRRLHLERFKRFILYATAVIVLLRDREKYWEFSQNKSGCSNYGEFRFRVVFLCSFEVTTDTFRYFQGLFWELLGPTFRVIGCTFQDLFDLYSGFGSDPSFRS